MNRARVMVGAVLAGVVAVGCGTNPAPGGGSAPPGTAASAMAAGQSPVAAASSAAPSATPPTPAAHVRATIPIEGNPNGMIEAFGSVWVAGRHANTVYRIDPASNRVTASIAVGEEPSFFVSDGAAVWVAQFGARSLARIDPITNAVEQVALPGDLGGPPAAGAGAVWQGTSAGIIKVDTSSLTVAGSITPGGPSGVAFADDLAWTAQPDGMGIRRIDARTLIGKDVVATGVDASGAVNSDGSSFWASNGNSVTRLDVKSGKVLATSALPDGVDGGMAQLSGGRIWLARLFPVAFTDIDPMTGRLDPMQGLPTTVTSSLSFLDLGPHDLWISDWDGNVVYRVDPAP